MVFSVVFVVEDTLSRLPFAQIDKANKKNPPTTMSLESEAHSL